MALPNFLIVGAPKCGTTSLYHYLKQHHDVYMPELKEPHFFIDWKKSVKTLEDYKALFAKRQSEKAIGEASTGYLYCESAPNKIKTLVPGVKIIIMLRNPADMVFSLWRHNHRKHHDRLYFKEALNKEHLRMNDPHLHMKHGTWHANFYYFHRALYYNQVKRYIDTFGRDNVLTILFEDFRNNTLGTCRRVYEFLEVDPCFIPKIEVHNEGVERRSRHFHELINQPPEPLALLGKMLPEKLAKNTKALLSRLNRKPAPIFEKSHRQELLNAYRSDINKLGTLIGKDLSFWYH